MTTIHDDATVTLTDAGRQYALIAAEHNSTLACVALAGRDFGDWPEAHVGSSIRLCNQRGREVVAEAAFLSTYDGPWSIKASEEDVLLSILRAVRPDLGLEGFVGIYALRGNERMTALVAALGDLMEEGLTSKDIVRGILAEIDETRLP